MTTECYLTFAQSGDTSAVVQTLAAEIKALGFQPYDPFPGGRGPAALWKQTVKAFVEPARDDWVRVLGQVPPEALAAASQTLGVRVLHVWLTDPVWGYFLFVDGDDDTTIEALADLLHHGKSLDDVRQAMQGELDPTTIPPLETAGSAIPDEVERLAETRGVDMDQAQRMIDKWTDKLFSKLDKQSGGEANALRAQAAGLLETAPSVWEAPSGQRVRAFCACLALPADWPRPALDAVREAYMVARRKAHTPAATLLPSDEKALARVPGAIDYAPLDFGRRD